MRKSILILLCLSVSYCLMAQETVNQKEIGLVFSNLDNFGLTFKTGTEKSLWRFNTLFITGSIMDNDNPADSILIIQRNMGYGVRIGREYRKNVVDNLELIFGVDISFTYSHSKSEYDDKSFDENDSLIKQTTYTPGVNLAFGFNYKIGENFVIGTELLPGIHYTTRTSIKTDYNANNVEEVKSDISGFSYGLSNTSVLLSLAYRY